MRSSGAATDVENEARLDYAPVPRRRRLRLRNVAILLLLALFIALFRWGEPLWNRAQLLYWQHRCLTYTKPSNTPMRSYDPPTIERLRGDGDYDVDAAGTWANLQPACWSRFENSWYQGIKSVSSGPGPPRAIVFLHERRSGERRRLICVKCWDFNLLRPDRPDLYLEWLVIEPATLLAPPRIVGSPRAQLYSGSFVPGKLYYGRPDPADPSHFTIEFDEHNRSGRRETIDGYLRSDDTIEFKLRAAAPESHPPPQAAEPSHQ